MNCTHTLGVCDDNDACTIDACDSSKGTGACSYSPLNCTLTPTVCQVSLGCDKVNGCLYNDLVCPEPADWCTTSICDEKVGCVQIPRVCLVSDADCYVGVCDSVKKTCTETKRDNFATITSSKKGGVTCFLAYEKKKAAAIITAGAVAGIVIGAVVFAALAALGARQAYMWMQLRQGAMGAAQGNPLYQPNQNAGENGLYAS